MFKTRITETLGIQYPVIQGAMLRASLAELAAAVSNAGGLGMMASDCDMALACDIRIASENASFGEVFIRRGLIPDMGGMFFLPRLASVAKAKELIFTDDIIDAREAERIGLVNKVVPAEKLEIATMELARRLASCPTRAIGLAKKVINKSLSTDLETSLDYALQALTPCYYTEHHA